MLGRQLSDLWDEFDDLSPIGTATRLFCKFFEIPPIGSYRSDHPAGSTPYNFEHANSTGLVHNYRVEMCDSWDQEWPHKVTFPAEYQQVPSHDYTTPRLTEFGVFFENVTNEDVRRCKPNDFLEKRFPHVSITGDTSDHRHKTDCSDFVSRH